MSRFVILRHETPVEAENPSHFDFMLEADAVLVTWSLSQPPDNRQPQTARRLSDHRIAYLAYKGPISGDRGSVEQWDRGSYRIEQQTDDRWVVIVDGTSLCGRVELVRLGEESHRWRFSYNPT